MKTSMAYRLYRLYFNSNADNHQLFGNRVHSPLNNLEVGLSTFSPAIIRVVLIAATLGTIAFVATL